MAAGLPDLVDYARLAQDTVVIERVYALQELPRLQDVLATPAGDLMAHFAFAKAGSGRSAATVTVHGVAQLVCQRCLKGFAYPVSEGSEVEFTDDEHAGESQDGRELFRAEAGKVSLRVLAEEELLLSLPIAASCSDPERCANAPGFSGDPQRPTAAQDASESDQMRRPFLALRELLKKT